MCLYSKIIPNKKYTPNKKNKGIVPIATDKRILAVPTKCRKCIECVKQKSREWNARLKEDIKKHKNGIFVTLTISNKEITKLLNQIGKYKGYETDNEIATLAVRRFTERWRKKHTKAPRHWLITELGHNGTENIHLHGIIWTDEPRQEIEKIWNYGYIYPRYDNQLNYVNDKTINYIIKYITKQDQDHKRYTPRIYNSKGIGSNYTEGHNWKLNKYQENGKTNENYKNQQGYKMAMPIYWRNKIYTEEEREKLWIEKLNKNERWICGEKIIGTDEEYYKTLEYHRKRAKRLGYNDDSKNWNKLQYENQRRKFNMDKRIKKEEAAQTPLTSKRPAKRNKKYTTKKIKNS